MVTWEAIYKNGASFRQNSIKYSDIDRAQLMQFNLYDNLGKFVTVNLNNDKTLFYRKRVCVDNHNNTTSIYIVGWRTTDDITILTIFDDGHMELLDEFREGSSWLYPINYTKDEEV